MYLPAKLVRRVKISLSRPNIARARGLAQRLRSADRGFDSLLGLHNRLVVYLLRSEELRDGTNVHDLNEERTFYLVL